MVTTFGGLAMLTGIVLLGVRYDTFSLSGVLAAAAATGVGSAYVVTAVVLLLVGALTKSALVPFHFWLPGAMAAPTPVSAYLHAAAMVKAGVYLVAVLAPVFAGTPGWRPILLTLGAATMIIGGWRSLRQYDIKVLLAYGTVSQLGFLVVLCGIGTRSAALGGIALLVGHALFKSTLFLVVGIVDHSAGHARPAPAERRRPADARRRRRGAAGRRLDGGRAADARLRGQGGRLREPDLPRRRGRHPRPAAARGAPRRRAGRRFRADRRLHAALLVGRVHEQARRLLHRPVRHRAPDHGRPPGQPGLRRGARCCSASPAWSAGSSATR